jgi:hypothetical protein
LDAKKIHAQGLATHGQTPQTWEQGKKLIDGIKNMRAMER